MLIYKVNFYKCIEEFDKRYDEIFLLKDYKLHFALFGSNIKDGVVDGAKSKWKKITFLDGLITIAVDQCPEGHRILKRLFDQYKCIIHSIKMSIMNDHSYINIPIEYGNIELFTVNHYIDSARNAKKWLFFNHRESRKLTRDDKKKMVLFTSQLKALLPKNVHIDSSLNDAALLDHLIKIVDEQDLFIKAIKTTIKKSVEKDVDDYLVKHQMVINSRINNIILSNNIDDQNVIMDDSIDIINDHCDFIDDHEHAIEGESNSNSTLEMDLNCDYNDLHAHFTVISNDSDESDALMDEYDDSFDEIQCNITQSKSKSDYESNKDSNCLNVTKCDPIIDNDTVPVDIIEHVISLLNEEKTEEIVCVNGSYTTPNSSLINYNSNQIFGELESYDTTNYN